MLNAKISLHFPDDPERREDERHICPAVSLMKPILRFLQLLCENHNARLQVRAALCTSGFAGLWTSVELIGDQRQTK